MTGSEPDPGCRFCERLATFRDEVQVAEPNWFNAPVPTFGTTDAALLVVGLAPGLRGANRSGRPFTGDYAGDLLYATLLQTGFATGTYGRRPDDGLRLVGCAVTNAVRCVPPQNKPTPEEIRTCSRFLTALLERMAALRAIVALGRIAHDSVLRTLGVRLTEAPFGHGRRHDLPQRHGRSLTLFDSYHCSRYNTNTGVLTATMFLDVFAQARSHIADTNDVSSS